MRALRAALPGAATLAALAEVLHSWRWRHSLLGLAIGLAHIALGPGGSMLLWPIEADKHYPSALLHYVLLFGLPLVLAVRLADRAVDRGAAGWRAYGLAVLAVALLGSWGGWALQLSIWAGTLSTQTRNAWLALAVAMLHAMGVAAYAHARQAGQSLARLRGAELERAQQARQLQLQRLLALQARIEPALLFHALRRILDLSRHDAAAADALLADLNELLRALLPGADAGLSTLGRECALLQAYARVSAGLRLRVTLAQADAGIALAPMLLLPMLRALEGTVGHGQDYVLSAAAAGAGLRVHLATAAGAAHGEPALQELRERLAGLYAQAGRLRLLPGPGNALELELPLHHDARTHR